jgi:putative membrane protein
MQSLRLAILSAACLATALAQVRTASRTDPTRTMSSHEVRFIQETLNNGRQEVVFAQLALKQSSNPDVTGYAQRLINDHDSENKRLEQIANEYGIPEFRTGSLYTSIAYRSSQERTSMNWTGIDPKTHQGVSRSPFDRLAAKSGADFDRAFAAWITQDHEGEVSKFEIQQKTTTNPDLKGFIDSSLPTLRVHLTQARAIK